MTDYRAELQALVNSYDEHGGRWPSHHEDALADAVDRARAALAEQPVGPTDEELWELYQGPGTFSPAEYARAVLARWGQLCGIFR